MKDRRRENPKQPNVEKDIPKDYEAMGKVKKGNDPLQPLKPERQS